MNNQEIYKKVEDEVTLMVLETFEGMEIEHRLGTKRIEIRPVIMNFVTKAIRKTIDYKDSEDPNG